MKHANEFIPGLTPVHFAELIYSGLCTLTVTRETCDEPGVFAFSVTDWKQETHQARLTLRKPQMEVLTDLSYQCTCPDFSNLQQNWGVVCDHIMVAMEEAMEAKDELFSPSDEWKRLKLSSATTSETEEEEEEGENAWAKALQEADPAELVKRMQVLAALPEHAAFFASLFPGQ